MRRMTPGDKDDSAFKEILVSKQRNPICACSVVSWDLCSYDEHGKVCHIPPMDSSVGGITNE